MLHTSLLLKTHSSVLSGKIAVILFHSGGGGRKEADAYFPLIKEKGQAMHHLPSGSHPALCVEFLESGDGKYSVGKAEVAMAQEKQGFGAALLVLERYSLPWCAPLCSVRTEEYAGVK